VLCECGYVYKHIGKEDMKGLIADIVVGRNKAEAEEILVGALKLVRKRPTVRIVSLIKACSMVMSSCALIGRVESKYSLTVDQMDDVPWYSGFCNEDLELILEIEPRVKKLFGDVGLNLRRLGDELVVYIQTEFSVAETLERLESLDEWFAERSRGLNITIDTEYV